MIIEHFVFNADAAPGFLRLSATALCEFLSVLDLVPGITVSQ
jgi:hypothetical protein